MLYRILCCCNTPWEKLKPKVKTLNPKAKVLPSRSTTGYAPLMVPCHRIHRPTLLSVAEHEIVISTYVRRKYTCMRYHGSAGTNSVAGLQVQQPHVLKV